VAPCLQNLYLGMNAIMLRPSRTWLANGNMSKSPVTAAVDTMSQSKGKQENEQAMLLGPHRQITIHNTSCTVVETDVSYSCPVNFIFRLYGKRLQALICCRLFFVVRAGLESKRFIAGVYEQCEMMYQVPENSMLSLTSQTHCDLSVFVTWSSQYSVVLRVAD
jgi:hypothetical protein